MKNYLSAYEQNGRYYFEDGSEKAETSELVNVDAITWDERAGWMLDDGRPMQDIIIKE